MRTKRNLTVSQSHEEPGGDVAILGEEQFWERMFNSVPDLIAILDRNHRILRVNRAMAQRLGCMPEECIGLRCYESVHGLSQPPTFCPHALTLAKGKIRTTEVHEDRLGDFLVTTTPLCDESGQVIGSIHVARDIAEQKEQQAKLRHLLEASNHERQLMGWEIHDGLTQQLTAAIMHFDIYFAQKEQNPQQSAEALARGVQLVHEGHTEARRLIGGLRPSQLEEGGIVSAVESLVRQASNQYKIKIEFSNKAGQLRLEPMLEKSVFRIVQECVTNACRHSRSKKVKVELRQFDGQLRIEVHDWGVGFNVDRVQQGHYGLEGIQERARTFGGHVVIKSRSRKGTDIVVDFPLHSSNIVKN